MVVVSYCRGHPRLVLVKCLEGLSLPRNSATTINFLNIRTPQKIVVITLKVEQDGVSLE